MKRRSIQLSDRQKDFLQSLCFLSPSLLGVGVFFILPFGVVVYYSLIDGVGSKNFVFLENFIKLFHNAEILLSCSGLQSAFVQVSHIISDIVAGRIDSPCFL